MKTYTKRGVIETIFYLAASDGEISAEETTKLDEIGWGVDPDHYESYRKELPTAVRKQMESGYEPEDQYDVIVEGVDRALAWTSEGAEDAIPSRLLVWDLLVIAFSDGQYHAAERRLIKHVARVSGIEKSVFLQMEQMIWACQMADKELLALTSSGSSSATNKPWVDELVRRRRVILTEASALIEDELNEKKIDALTYEPDVFDKAKSAVSEAVAPVAIKVAPVTSAIGERAGKIVDGTKEAFWKTAAPVAAEISKQTDKLVGLLGKKKSGKEGQ